MSPERNDASLDPEIFDYDSGKRFTGTGEEVLGKVGEIVKTGEYLSLNFGLDPDDGGNRLLVLDTNKKSIAAYTFRHNFSLEKVHVETWGLTYRHEFSDEEENGFWNPEFFYPKFRELVSKINELYPSGRTDPETLKVKDALAEAAKPLIEHFVDEIEDAQKWLKLLTGTESF